MEYTLLKWCVSLPSGRSFQLSSTRSVVKGMFATIGTWNPGLGQDIGALAPAVNDATRTMLTTIGFRIENEQIMIVPPYHARIGEWKKGYALTAIKNIPDPY